MSSVLLKTIGISSYDMDGPLDVFIAELEKVRDEAKAKGIKNVRLDTDWEYDAGDRQFWTVDIVGDTE